MKGLSYFWGCSLAIFVAIGCGGKGLEPTNNGSSPTTSGGGGNIIPVIETFSINNVSSPSSVPYNKAATLRWTTKNAASCSIGTTSNPALASGTDSAGTATGLITAGTTFTISCTSSDGTTRSLSIAVTVPAGSWHNVLGQVCSSYCAAAPRLLTNVPSPEGLSCASGENRPATSGPSIVYSRGTFGSVRTTGNAVSVGNDCYHPDSGLQERDGDSTDETVACYCR